MDIQRTLEILEALAAGCSPTTGAVLQEESVLQERDVIRALQMAIDLLKKERLIPKSDVDIAQEDIEAAIQLFHEQGKSPTANNLTGFLGGTRQFKNEALVSHERYGKYKHMYSHGLLLDFFTAYLQQHPVPVNTIRAKYHWREMEFFKQAIFNRLTPGAIQQLKEKVQELGVLKTDNLSASVLTTRISYPRAYEAWSVKEKELLTTALKYTNDLDLLSACFQRGKGSIGSCAQQLLPGLHTAQEKTTSAQDEIS